MTEARELDTNMDTLVGHNLDAPWVGDKNFPEMEGEEDFPCHQPSDDDVVFEPHSEVPDEDEAVPDWVPTEAEKDAASRLRALTNDPPRAAKAAKRPRSPLRDPDEVPDLAEIFDNYDTPHPVRISVCRAYASYISSLQPKKPKKAVPKRKN